MTTNSQSGLRHILLDIKGFPTESANTPARILLLVVDAEIVVDIRLPPYIVE